MGTDFARRGGQVMVFKIFTRKSQKIDLVQDVKDVTNLAIEKKRCSLCGKEIGDMGFWFIGEGYQGLDADEGLARHPKRLLVRSIPRQDI